MNRTGSLLLALTVVAGCLKAASAQELALPVRSYASASDKLPIALANVPATVRDNLTKVMQAPTLTAMAPPEEFASTAESYLWLLDHPERVCLAWQRLKVAAIDITASKDGKFTWKDEQGSELTWSAVAQNGEGRIWYAEGKVRPGRLLPLVPVKAVAILRHGVVKDEDGEPLIRHQVEVFLQTDSRTAALVMRLIGPAAPRLAQEGAEQMLLFFSGIARYVDRHPSKAKMLLADKK